MTKRTSHSYYVVMEDFGQRGLEATVRPELTRRNIVEMLATGESKHVAFIHHVDGLYIEDVTNELFDEAEVIARAHVEAARNVGMNAHHFDHVRDYRKHEVA